VSLGPLAPVRLVSALHKQLPRSTIPDPA
jgi:hypothetical protein